MAFSADPYGSTPFGGFISVGDAEEVPVGYSTQGLMYGGFNLAPLEHPQYGYSGDMHLYPDMEWSSVVKTPDEPMWLDSDPDTETTSGTNPFNVVFDDVYNGIFDVDDVIDNDETTDWAGVYDLSDEENLL